MIKNSTAKKIISLSLSGAGAGGGGGLVIAQKDKNIELKNLSPRGKTVIHQQY